jgi:SNF2 family DNA or RNA helicase
VRIDGGTSVDERQSIVDNFNTRGIGQVRLGTALSCFGPRQ